MKRRFGSFFYKRKSGTQSEPRPIQTRSSWPVRFLKKACFYVGALVLFSMFMGFVAGLLFGQKSSSDLPDKMVLALDIVDPIGETEHARSLTDPLASMGMTVGDIINTLDRAGKDKRVHTLIVRLDAAGIELAHIQELRAAVKRFRAEGKKAYIYTASFADLGSGIGAYYLASAFDQIWLQPSGHLSITGISISMPFARNTLDKVGVRPEFLHREEYKSAMESFTNSEMSPANREMMTSILNDFSGQISKDIAADRKLTRNALQSQIDKGLLSATDALKAGLIDRADYADAMEDEAVERSTKTADKPPGAKKHDRKDESALQAVDFSDYFEIVTRPDETVRDPNVALIRVTGEIVQGHEPEPGFAPGDYIASAINEAAEDPSVKVIVLRIDSPGGSPSASETIRRAAVKAKSEGKKIIVSMGPLAASGGYWIAADADEIFAMPTTLTGSIGVIMGKFELSGLWEKLGVNWQSLSWGENAELWSMNDPLSESERAALEAAIDDTYKNFVGRVAAGRGMKDEAVRKIAKGRAWTGGQAQQIGLVDHLGGLDAALDEAAKIAGVKGREQLRIIDLPKPLSPLEQIMRLMGRSSSVAQSVAPLFLSGHASPAERQIASVLRQARVMDRIGPVQVYDPRLQMMTP